MVELRATWILYFWIKVSDGEDRSERKLVPYLQSQLLSFSSNWNTFAELPKLLQSFEHVHPAPALHARTLQGMAEEDLLSLLANIEVPRFSFHRLQKFQRLEKHKSMHAVLTSTEQGSKSSMPCSTLVSRRRILVPCNGGGMTKKK